MHHKSNTSVNTLFIVSQTANPLLPSVILLLIPFKSECKGQSIRTILAISLSTLLGSLVSGYLIDIGVLIALGALAVQKKSVRV